MDNYSIIIIDDNETDRYLLKRLLKKVKINFNIFEAENGRAALDFFTKKNDSNPPLMIFLDLNMPLMDGFEFLEKFSALRSEREDLKSAMLTMLTSSDRKEDILKAKSYDFVDNFITKGSLSIEDIKESLLKKFPDISFED